MEISEKGMLPVCDPARTPIGWIGTGVMGSAMCGHLLDAGYAVTVFNRHRAKAEPLLERGARWAASAAEVAASCHVVFTMVGFPEDVREVYFGPKGIFEGLQQGSVLVDMTTTEPRLAQAIHAEARRRGAWAVDAPVSGGDVGARQATLSIMVGGDAEAVQAVEPLLRILGKNIVHHGPAGSGQHAKMCNQIVIAGTMIGVCESLLYAMRAGLDPEKVLQSIRGGAAACWALDNLVPRMMRRDFEPGFYVEHFIKDMGIALEESQRLQVVLPGLALVHQLYTAVKAQGYGRKGTQALLLALETLAGHKPSQAP
ncbi:NAD(P)-dependent oxidoreductase [Desulfosoma caldarium]|uniref:3-hydroxyisobutyrate dehydrogenase n=1 Tax=Desulfosoma caldarium TaxID=610254 RepID=A0A3N1VLI6_9BACT|nr:NAD(P)-dependent oxidoreductase [Desulfosoma caldarium]ROR02909.1 3-hydroxyisobutyrate dehydrogenase [Desulfosoma caldarium]